MTEQKESNDDKLNRYIRAYLASSERGDELEVRFGTKHWNPITLISFNKVISKLKSLGFKVDYELGSYHLNIQNEYTDANTGRTKMSNIRTEIHDLHNIKSYCKTNTFDFDNPPSNIIFRQKRTKMLNEERLSPIDYEDFHFRVNYKTERNLRSNFGVVSNMLQTWQGSKKTFRLIKRFTFTHPRHPLKVDCSIVKSSKKYPRSNRFIPEFRIESSDVFKNAPTYEIEIELDKNAANFPSLMHIDELVPIMKHNLKKVIKMVMSGLQNSNYPISYTEADVILNDYMKLLYKNKPPERRIRTSDFVGPSSISLELENVRPIDLDSSVANIRQNYTVTDKADGLRKLFYIHETGKCYMIDVNMKVQFTGLICDSPDYLGSIMDGEHVIHDKNKNYINHFLAFDLYYLKKQDVRSFAFIDYIVDANEDDDEDDDSKEMKGETKGKKQTFRLQLLTTMMKNCHFVPFVGNKMPLKVHKKRFYAASGMGIFKKCGNILKKEEDGLFDYEIDGLIFTPCDKGVGSDKIGEVLEPRKLTWSYSLKWKPPAFNTIDFLVTTKKLETGEDFVGTLYEEGVNMTSDNAITQFKTLILRVGFDERNPLHGYLNPCEDVIQGRNPTPQEANTDGYKPVPFYPNEPSADYPVYLCNINIEKSGGSEALLTEDGTESFEDGTIVEFRFEKDAARHWQWKPIRVRHKKTAEYRAGGKNYGNAYHVAQSVWRSIHNPVTHEMIATGIGIPDEVSNDNKYYNRKTSKSLTVSLRNFHNLYVKRKLIEGVSKRGDILFDQAVGKGGDFSKWIGAKLRFVFGLDVARDNIENRMDGACARYLNYKKRYKVMPSALFVRGDSSLNTRNGDSNFTDKGRLITRAVFGSGPKDEELLGGGVYKHYGIGKDGFNVISNQFAIHYFFENKVKLNNLLRNVSECCKMNGYFIGTTYDGKRLFQQLENKELGESVKIVRNEHKIWEITKRYDNPRFMNDETCLGYKIDVYQETINKVFSEYLVNFEYFINLIENYGFVPLTKEEARSIGMPNSIGDFSELFYKMEDDIETGRMRRSNIKDSLKMSKDEKRISFLNKYFIFKKVRDVNAKDVANLMIGASVNDVNDSNIEVTEAKKIVEKVNRPKSKKIGKKLKLFSVTEMEGNEADKQPEEKSDKKKRGRPKKLKMKLGEPSVKQEVTKEISVKTETLEESKSKCTPEKEKICEEKNKICNPKTGRCNNPPKEKKKRGRPKKLKMKL